MKRPQTMPIKCKIWWDTNTQSYIVSSSYNEKLVDALKNVIPSSDRSFDPKTKFWFLTEPYGEALRKIAEACFGVGGVSFVSKQVAEQSRQRQTLPASQDGISTAIAQFFALLSYDAAKAAYRKAALELHPDREGKSDPQRMAQLNDLWSRIEKEVYRR